MFNWYAEHSVLNIEKVSNQPIHVVVHTVLVTWLLITCCVVCTWALVFFSQCKERFVKIPGDGTHPRTYRWFKERKK